MELEMEMKVILGKTNSFVFDFLMTRMYSFIIPCLNPKF